MIISGKVTFPWGNDRVYEEDYVIDADQKISNYLLRIHFWERLKLQLGQELNLGLILWA